MYCCLDSQTGREVLDYLQQLNTEGRTVVLITHDNSIARQAQRIVRLEDGKIVHKFLIAITKLCRTSIKNTSPLLQTSAKQADV